MTELDARRNAVACSTDTVVAGSLSEWTTPTVLSDTGDLSVEYSTTAERQDSDGDGVWAPVDVQVGSARVTSGELAGMLPVTGGVEPMWLNPGGAAGEGLALAVIGAPDERVSMFSSSLALENAGVATSDIATPGRVSYDFGGGVSLVVSINTDGTSVTPVVRLADESALARLTDELLPGGDQAVSPLALEFPLSMSEGLSLHETTVGFEVRDSEGNVTHESGPALMWDSTGEEVWDGVGTDEGVDSLALSRQAPSEVEAQSASANGATGDRLETPASGDRVAAMGVQVEGDTVVVTPDVEMLASADLEWPLHLDPKIGKSTPNEWAMAQSHWPSTVTWKASGTQAVGLCDPGATIECTASNVQRLFWQFGGLRQGSNGPWLGELPGSSILEASFGVYGTHSWDCSTRSIDVYAVEYFENGVSWNNQPGWGRLQDSRLVSHKIECDNRKMVYFDVTDRARSRAGAGQSNLSVGMQAPREDSMSWWKRYQSEKATLTISYDRPPLAPNASQTKIEVGAGEAELGCENYENRVQVRDKTPTLKARATEPDGTNAVSMRFRLEDQDTFSPFWWSGWSSSGSAETWKSRPVPGEVGLKSGKTYRWRVQVKSKDPVTGHVATTAWSDSPLCFFTVDTEYPNPPKVTSSTYPERQVAGGTTTPIELTFAANGSADVVRYEWSVNDQTYSKQPKDVSPGGSVTFSTPVLRAGLNYVAVRSRDDANLVSDSVIYEFYVRFPQKTGHWQFNDAGWAGGGLQAASNSEPSAGAGVLTIGPGVAWVAGSTSDGLWPPSTVPGADPDGRVPDGALVFDQPSDIATTAVPVVSGDRSYTISAFVRADAVPAAGSDATLAAAVSQVPGAVESVSGDIRSSFGLGWAKDADCTEQPAGEDLPCWAFWHARSPSSEDEEVISHTKVPVVVGQWAHVVGIFNAADETVEAWACPMFAEPAVRPSAGETMQMGVDLDGEPVAWEPWNTAGGLRLGSGLEYGEAAWPFTGAIDEVRVYDGHVVDEDTLNRTCRQTQVP
ncbi:DNRLRE domain-containing protein [Promicromonospora kroppenstedtii]|uniref:DNRLRE domain-containing protein n=1 Tax=Promicromonospora kroppenstedtii TaxID=440482 RepID=UPI0004B28778|nr:DNRLRE domain-containing protein [Promicromonospora kroppenstedtii]